MGRNINSLSILSSDMCRFVVKLSLLTGLCLLAVFCAIVLRLIWFDIRDLQRGNEINSGTRYLFIGSSAIGCGICESNSFANTVLWRTQVPPQFTLMRLRELEKIGRLDGIETVIFELGYQSIQQNSKEVMNRLSVEMAPFSWKYLDLLPIRIEAFLYRLIKNRQAPYQVRERGHPAPSVSLSQKAESWIADDLKRVCDAYFEVPRSEKLMCKGWQDSLTNAICGIEDFCRKHAIRPVALLCPVCSRFRRAVPADAEERFAKLLKACVSYNIRVVDGRSAIKDGDFMNVNHLNAKGAALFTEWLYREAGFSVTVDGR